MIAQKTVEEIFETARIEDVVGEFVQLRKRGSNYQGLCPFHNEKTPSFSVSPSKGIYKCFGCGEAGNAVGFIMEHENMSYPEALRYLAAKYNIEIEEDRTNDVSDEERQRVDSLYIVNQYAHDYYQKQMLETDRGKSVALSYFRNRGYRDETIRKFGLGYAPGKGDAFTHAALHKGYQLELLQDIGLTTQYKKDFFRDRVMFPFHSMSGKIIGFGGRILTKDKKAPKYINSIESEVYQKSTTLYGVYFAKRPIRKADECIMVEGYTDVISLHQAGIETAVASSGTSLTEGQVQRIKRMTDNIKFVYDGDKAGIKAALRGLDMVLAQDMNVRVVMLPDGEDPDSYLQSVGVTAFREYITEQAQDFILFKTNLLLDEVKDDPIRRTELVKDVVESIALVPDQLKRSVYVQQCARVMELSESVLLEETNRVILTNLRKAEARNRSREQAPSPNAPPPDPTQPRVALPKKEEPAVNLDETYERELIRLLIAHGDQTIETEEVTVAEYVLAHIEDILDDFSHALYGSLARDCYRRLLHQQPVDSSYFTRHSDPKVQKLAADCLVERHILSPNWEEKLDHPLQTQPPIADNFARDSIENVQRYILRKMVKLYDNTAQSIQTAEQQGDMVELMRLLKVQLKLQQQRDALAKELGVVVV